MDDFAINPGSLTVLASPMRRSDLALDLQQWTRALEQATQEAAQCPVGEAKARALLTAARAHWHLDDFLACLKLALQCLANRDLDTPASISVHAMTLAAFALNELGATEKARILAQRALVQTRLEFLFDLLPTALSCAAHIESCSGNLERAETLHLEAIQHARDSTDNDALQMALGNFLISYINLLRNALSDGNAATAEAVKRKQWDGRPHPLTASMCQSGSVSHHTMRKERPPCRLRQSESTWQRTCSRCTERTSTASRFFASN